MSVRKRWSCWLWLVPALLSSGCWRPPAPTLYQREVGLIWVLPGVVCTPPVMFGVYRGLRDGGVDGEIRLVEWDRPAFDLLGQLTEIERNRAFAQQLADETVAYRAKFPHAPIDLVGYSAGGGIALLLAEALPPAVRLRNVVLVQPAASPTWDLTPALRHVDGRLVNMYCESDWLFLGWGTSEFGTVDRENVAAAGKVGFHLVKACPDPALRARVEQVRWDPEMVRAGHFGTHLSILNYAWNKAYVAPYLRPQRAEARGPTTYAGDSAGAMGR